MAVEYSSSKTISDNANKFWKKYLETELFGPQLTLAVVDLQDDEYYRFQKSKFGDMIIIIDDEEKPFYSIELKVRKQSDEIFFLRHRDIAIETKGNNSKLNDDGSAIHNSRADLFGTAFYTPEGLKHVHIFRLKDGLKEWLIENKHKYQEKKNLFTDGKYNSSWIPVPLDDIQQFLIRPRKW